MTADGTVRRLYKSRTERMIDGVCGGISEYFGLDPTLVRISWVLLTLLGGTGIFLYIVCMIVMPANPSKEVVSRTRSSSANSRFWGILLVVVGILWMLDNLGVPFWHHWWGFSWDMALPLLLILAGVAFLFGGRNYVAAPAASPATGSSAETGTQQRPGLKKLYRSRSEKKLFGVCGGLGEFLEIDPVLVRVLFVVAAFASFGIMILLYIVMAILVPRNPVAVQTA